MRRAGKQVGRTEQSEVRQSPTDSAGVASLRPPYLYRQFPGPNQGSPYPFAASQGGFAGELRGYNEGLDRGDRAVPDRLANHSLPADATLQTRRGYLQRLDHDLRGAPRGVAGLSVPVRGGPVRGAPGRAPGRPVRRRVHPDAPDQRPDEILRRADEGAHRRRNVARRGPRSSKDHLFAEETYSRSGRCCWTSSSSFIPSVSRRSSCRALLRRRKIRARKRTAFAGFARPIWSTFSCGMRHRTIRAVSAKTLSAHEPFMIYMKASLLVGVLLASPWIFYQIWSFVAAGLYPHEKQYVHIFLPFSLGLFLLGASRGVLLRLRAGAELPVQLQPLAGHRPDPRISEWLGFVLMLPLGFGISLPVAAGDALPGADRHLHASRSTCRSGGWRSW